MHRGLDVSRTLRRWTQERNNNKKTLRKQFLSKKINFRYRSSSMKAALKFSIMVARMYWYRYTIFKMLRTFFAMHLYRYHYLVI